MATREDVPINAAGSRPIIFVPIKPHGTIYAYVTEAALGLAYDFAAGVELDGATMPLRELPDGLGVLLGKDTDVTAYERARR